MHVWAAFCNFLALLVLDPYKYSPHEGLAELLLSAAPAYRWVILSIPVQEPFETPFVGQSHSCILVQGPRWGPRTPALPILIVRFGKCLSLHVCFLQIMSSWVSDLIPNSQAGALFSWRWRSRSDWFLPPTPPNSLKFASRSEEAWLHVSRALSIRVTGSGALALSCVTGDAGLLRTKARGSGALWLTPALSEESIVISDRGRKEFGQNKGRKNLFISFHQPSLWFLLPRI